MKDLYRSQVIDAHRKNRIDLVPVETDVSPAYGRIPGIEVLLFDIYGTLLISGSGDVGTALEQSHSLPFEEALKTAGVADPDPSQVERAETIYFDSIRLSHEKSRVSGIDFPEVDILTIWHEVFAELGHGQDKQTVARVAALYETLVNPVCIMPAAAETLSSLRDSGLHMGIVSNAQFYTPTLLEFELKSRLEDAGFDHRLCSYSYRTGAAKPSITIFKPVLEYLLKTYDISPSQVLYVGNDMLNDIYTAMTSGCRTCLFAGDRRSLRLRENDDRTAGLQADAIITKLPQILEIVAE